MMNQYLKQTMPNCNYSASAFVESGVLIKVDFMKTTQDYAKFDYYEKWISALINLLVDKHLINKSDLIKIQKKHNQID